MVLLDADGRRHMCRRPAETQMARVAGRMPRGWSARASRQELVFFICD